MSKLFGCVNKICSHKNPYSHIETWKFSELLGVVGYGYVLQFLLEKLKISLIVLMNQGSSEVCEKSYHPHGLIPDLEIT